MNNEHAADSPPESADQAYRRGYFEGYIAGAKAAAHGEIPEDVRIQIEGWLYFWSKANREAVSPYRAPEFDPFERWVDSMAGRLASK